VQFNDPRSRCGNVAANAGLRPPQGTSAPPQIGPVVVQTALLWPRLTDRHPIAPGTAVLAAAEVPEARAVVTIAAPADPAHAIGLFKDRIPKINARGEAEVVLAGRSFCPVHRTLTSEVEIRTKLTACLNSFVFPAPADRLASPL
jgi:hypothetical protein